VSAHEVWGRASLVPTKGDKVFGLLAIIVGIGVIVLAVLDLLVTSFVVIAASASAIVWLSIARRRPPSSYRDRSRH
jgi:hypothetical protein